MIRIEAACHALGSGLEQCRGCRFCPRFKQPHTSAMLNPATTRATIPPTVNSGPAAFKNRRKGKWLYFRKLGTLEKSHDPLGSKTSNAAIPSSIRIPNPNATRHRCRRPGGCESPTARALHFPHELTPF